MAMVDFDKASKQARERDEKRKNGGGGELARQDEPQGGALEMNIGSLVAKPEDIAQKLRSGAWEAAPQILTIAEGMTIIGFLECRIVDGAEVKDPATGELKLVDTWILRSLDGTGVRVSILSSAQLDKKLPHFEGGEVSITRLRTFKTSSGLQCTEYVCAGPKRTDGEPRDWSIAKQPQLPSGQAS